MASGVRKSVRESPTWLTGQRPAAAILTSSIIWPMMLISGQMMALHLGFTASKAS